MEDISDIKELVVQALTRKKVLSRLRAELRSNVFVTIDEEETSTGGEGLAKKTSTAARESFLKTEQGQLLADLVHEFLQWNNMEFTLRVFEPEISLGTEHRTRSELMRQLDVSGPAPQGPLLLALLQGQQGGTGQAPRSAMQPKPDYAASTRPPPPAPSRAKAEPEPEGSVGEQEDSYALEVESDDELGNAEIEAEDEDEDVSPMGMRAPAAGQRGDPEPNRGGALFGPMSDEIPSPMKSPYSPDSEGRDEFGKPRTLSPLAPIGGRAPLAPLAPLGGAKGLTPLSGGKKAPNDIKDELRRAGLLTLPTDSFSVSESSLDIPLHPEEPGLSGNRPSPSRLSIQSLPEPVASRLRLQDLNSSDVGQSLELRDFGIVPSDRPGDLDLDDADYAETAEWG